MAEYVVSSALETFTVLLGRHPDIGYGAMGHHIQKLKTGFETLLPLLPNADRRSSSFEIQQILDRIREASYKAVDVVEIFTLKQGLLDSISSMGSIREVKEIAQEIFEAATILRSLGVETSSGRDHTYKRQQKVRETYFNFGQVEVVGMEKSRHEMLFNLLHRDIPVGILFIVGMGGLGKTTLAQLVYNGTEVRNFFECFAWVTISQEFEINEVLKSILMQLCSSTAQHVLATDQKEMATMIIEILQLKRCVVVLDDVWDDRIFKYLPASDISKAKNSKIIVTTRIRDIVRSVQGDYFCFELESFSYEHSWFIFNRIAISKRDDTDTKDQMIKMGRKMIQHCVPIPLFISLLAGLLSTKETLEEWQAIYEKIMNLDSREPRDGLLNIFEFFYDELPYYLKPCFLYFTQFPEDVEIPVKRLIQMWIADGIISTMTYERDGQKETMEDVAYHYFSELADRYMIQIVKRNSTGKEKTCKMHDIMLDLAKSKAKQENFSNCFQLTSAYSFKVPRVCIRMLPYDSCDVIRQEQLFRNQNPRIRSLIYYVPTSWSGHLPNMLKLKRFKFLRVLRLENFTSTRDISIEQIGGLVILKFLSLKNSDISELPSSIFCLRYLQTLDLRTSAKHLKISNIMWRTENLRHLYMHPAYILKKGDKLKLGHLSNLQTLVNIDDADLQLEDVVEFGSLRKLVIIIRKMQEGFVISKEFEKVFKFKNNTLSRLQTLGIINTTSTDAEIRPLLSRCCAVYKMQVQGKITKLSECHQLSFNLVKLIINGTFLEEDPMATLEKLPNLCVLGFEWESFMGCKLVCSERGFPQLSFLRLHGLLKLQELAAEDGAMPLLSHLDISNCPNHVGVDYSPLKMNTIPSQTAPVDTLN